MLFVKLHTVSVEVLTVSLCISVGLEYSLLFQVGQGAEPERRGGRELGNRFLQHHGRPATDVLDAGSADVSGGRPAGGPVGGGLGAVQGRGGGVRRQHPSTTGGRHVFGRHARFGRFHRGGDAKRKSSWGEGRRLVIV